MWSEPEWWDRLKFDSKNFSTILNFSQIFLQMFLLQYIFSFEKFGLQTLHLCDNHLVAISGNWKSLLQMLRNYIYELLSFVIYTTRLKIFFLNSEKVLTICSYSIGCINAYKIEENQNMGGNIRKKMHFHSLCAHLASFFANFTILRMLSAAMI